MQKEVSKCVVVLEAGMIPFPYIRLDAKARHNEQSENIESHEYWGEIDYVETRKTAQQKSLGTSGCAYIQLEGGR